jgi:cysteine-rich repeat protein
MNQSMKLLLAAIPILSSCTLLFGGLNAGDRCEPEEFENNCSNNALHVCEGGVIFDIPCGDNGCNEDGTSCDDLCGDGAVTGAEECDASYVPKENEPPQPPCDPFCQRIPVCGDNEVDFPEQCDGTIPDSNNDCDSDCRIIPIQEIEPNDDPLLFFREPTITQDTVLDGTTSEPGDRDFFPIENTSQEATLLRIDMYSPETGLRAPCEELLEGFSILTEQASPLAAPENDREDACVGGEFSLAPGQRVLLFIDTNADTNNGPYLVELDFDFQRICGDGVVHIGEECEPPGLGICDLQCQRNVICGDGFIDEPESCDDGNTVVGDGCDAECLIELPLLTPEVEPNDDGTLIFGSDFSAENAQRDSNGQPFQADVILAGELAEEGGIRVDDDVFVFQNTSGALASLRLDTFATFVGQPEPCNFIESDLDTLLSIRDASGTLLAESSDRSPNDLCGGLTFALQPDQTVFAQVTSELPLIGVALPYLLVADFETIRCGDAQVDSIEQCDDGNELSGDGCSALCQLEGVTPETDPNDAANPQGPFTSDVVIVANSDRNDTDFFLLQNNAGEPRLVDVFLSRPIDGLGAPCQRGLFEISSSDPNGGDIDFVQTTRGDCEGHLHLLAPNQQLVFSVRDFGATSPSLYLLSIDFIECGNGVIERGEACDGGSDCNAQCQRVAVCGDGVVNAPETCDNGDTQSGDLCSSSCQLEFNEGTLESEPNDDGNASTQEDDSLNALPEGPISTPGVFVGSINPRGDEDLFLIENPTNVFISLQLDTYHPLRGIDQSCGAAIDTELLVPFSFFSGGIGFFIANDDRASDDRCSRFILNLAPQESVVIKVRSFDDGSIIPGYLFVVRESTSLCGNGALDPDEECDPPGTASCDDACQRVPICGDSEVDTPEQCDDGNALDGDGCDSSCQPELVGCEPGQELLLLSATDTPLSIPDNNPAGVASTIVVSDGRALEKAFVVIGSLTHTFVGDLQLLLVSPSGAEIELFSQAGGNGDNLSSTIFDNSCTVPINSGVAPFTGCFRPSGSLAALQAQSANGTWRLKLLDLAEQDLGTLDAWSLGLCVLGQGACSDGQQQFPEECDDGNGIDGDGCNASCLIEVCGDGIFQPTLNEECDDGNNTINDGCDNDCVRRADLVETEPNDDGSISLGVDGIDGNDFSSANAGGPFSSNVIILGAISPAGDEDVFAIENPNVTPIDVRLDLFSEGAGLGVACGASPDTGLTIRDSAGLLLAQNDDRAGAQDRCSGLTFTIAPNQTVFAHIVEFRDDEEIEGYFFAVDFQ